MAVTVQQIHPVAHLPLILGVHGAWRSLRLSMALSRAPLPMGSRVDVGSKPWYWPFWMGIMPSTRWGSGWKSAGW
jgi:hypothetical protein